MWLGRIVQITKEAQLTLTKPTVLLLNMERQVPATNIGSKNMSKQKKKPPKRRNPYVLPATISRKGGKMKDKRDKRAKENKSQDRYLDEDY